jgi:hypothetical protein
MRILKFEYTVQQDASIQYSEHTKVLSSQIDFGVIIPKACDSVQVITFFMRVRCILIFVMNGIGTMMEILLY